MNTSLTPGAIVAAREALGLTQEDVANRTGIPLRSYQAYERGEREPKSKRADAIRKVLRIGNVMGAKTHYSEGVPGNPLDSEGGGAVLDNAASNNREDPRGGGTFPPTYNPDEYMSLPTAEEIRVSAGGDGAIMPEPVISGQEIVRREEVAGMFHYDGNALRFIVTGDSMVPEHLDGERVYVEPVDDFRSPPDGKYIFYFDGMVYLKRLQFKPRGVVVARSVNPNYDDWKINLQEDAESFRLLYRIRDPHKQAMLYSAYAAIFRSQAVAR